MPSTKNVPLGVNLLAKCFGSCCQLASSEKFYKTSVLILTFISYMAYHLSRRPLSVVKNVLNRNCSSLVPPAGSSMANDSNWCNWEPFDGDDANTWLGALDSAYLVSYALFMYVSGFVAERCHLRYFIALGMIGSALLTYIFGLAYYYDIHSIWFFAIVQIISGALQTTGWPATFACVGHWFGPNSSRGIIFGIWNSHAFVGNILGAAIAGAYVDRNWGDSFMVPAIITAGCGFLMWLFLAPCTGKV